MVTIREPKTFYFDFDWPKNVDENLKHEIEFIIKSNESLADNKIKNISMEQYSWKTAKRMSHINLFLTCHKD